MATLVLYPAPLPCLYGVLHKATGSVCCKRLGRIPEGSVDQVSHQIDTMKKFKPYAITFGIAVAAIYVVFQVIPAEWRAKITG